MKNVVKRTLSLLLALVIGCSFCLVAFASEPNTPKEVEASERGLGSVIATNAGTIYGGSGTLTVTLPSGNYWADIVAGIGYSSERGIVTCSVLMPDGNVISLGSISGSGSKTDSYQVVYAPAGTYQFYFSSAISTPYEVVAYIYN